MVFLLLYRFFVMQYNTIQYPIPLPSPQTNLKIKVHTKPSCSPLVVLVSEKVISATSVIDIIMPIKSLLEKLFYWVTSSMCLSDRVKSARLVSERLTSVLEARCVYYRVTSARFIFDRVTSTWCVSYR